MILFLILQINSNLYILLLKIEKKPEKKVFDSYPIYLKHSLMIDDDENMDKVKEMEVSKRYL